MADDITKKILVDIEVKAEQLKRELPILTSQIDKLSQANKELKDEQDKLTKANQTGSEAYRNNSKEIIANAQQLRQLKAEVRDINKTIDNTAKAISGGYGNSIAQNRALLSLLTAEHVKLGTGLGNTQKEIDGSASRINKLTEVLKTQEKQIGQTYRNVGNYADSIKEAYTQIGSAIPGFQQFNSAMQLATKVGGFLPTAIANVGSAVAKTGQQFSSFVGFKQFTVQAEQATVSAVENSTATETMAAGEVAAGTAAEGAAGGFSMMSAAVIACTAVIAAVAAAVYGLIQYLKTLDSVGDGVQQTWAGMKAGFYAAAESIRAGDWKGLTANMEAARSVAASLTAQMQDLGDAMIAQEVHNAKAEEAIQDIMLRMRNKRTTAADEQKYFNEIQQISTDNYNQRKKQADELYNLTIAEVVNGKYLTKVEIADLKKRGVDAAIEYENQDKIAVGSYKKIADAQKKQIEADQFYHSVKERAQNRLDAKQMAEEQKAQAEKNKADQEARRLQQQQQKEIEAQLEAENQRKASANRVLQNIYEEYGDKVLAAQQSYDNEITKLEKFHAKKLISEQVYNANVKQLKAEHESNISKLIDDFQKKDADKLKAANTELINAHIASIDNDTERTIKGLEQRSAQELQQLDKSNADLMESREALAIEIKKLHGKELEEAQAKYDNEFVLISFNEKRRIQIELQTAKEIAEINRKALDAKNKLRDGNNVAEATKKFGGNSSQAMDAKKQQLLDGYNAEVSQAGLTADAKLEIERKYLADVAMLNDEARKNKFLFTLQAEQVVQSAAFDILSQGQQQQSEKVLRELDARKSAELNNQSLTSTQKRLIENKYAALEKQEKLKAFKANQKLQAANALINGVVAVLKNTAELGFIPAIPINALTIAATVGSIAKILSAKPGFATGGVYKSDGKGAILPGYSRHDNINSSLRSGEAVVVSEAMRVPWARNTVSKINEMFGGRSFATGGGKPAFAMGGLFTDGGNANRYFAKPVTDSDGLANSLAYQLINNFPNVIVDVKDIITQTSIKANVENRVIL